MARLHFVYGKNRLFLILNLGGKVGNAFNIYEIDLFSGRIIFKKTFLGAKSCPKSCILHRNWLCLKYIMYNGGDSPKTFWKILDVDTMETIMNATVDGDQHYGKILFNINGALLESVNFQPNPTYSGEKPVLVKGYAFNEDGTPFIPDGSSLPEIIPSATVDEVDLRDGRKMMAEGTKLCVNGEVAFDFTNEQFFKCDRSNNELVKVIEELASKIASSSELSCASSSELSCASSSELSCASLSKALEDTSGTALDGASGTV